MVNWVLAGLAILFYVLHQDIWFWNRIRPLAFGFLPVGLAYHAAYCVAIAGLMWLLVRYAWPSHLEAAAERRGQREGR
jgi:hypothetical protein